jgi:hypothetical protein
MDAPKHASSSKLTSRDLLLKFSQLLPGQRYRDRNGQLCLTSTQAQTSKKSVNRKDIEVVAFRFCRDHVRNWNAGDISHMILLKNNLIRVGQVNEFSNVINFLAQSILNLINGSPFDTFITNAPNDIILKIFEYLGARSIGRVRINRALRDRTYKVLQDVPRLSMNAYNPKISRLGYRLLSTLPYSLLLNEKIKSIFDKFPPEFVTELKFIFLESTDSFLENMYERMTKPIGLPMDTRWVMYPPRVNEDEQHLTLCEIIRKDEPLLHVKPPSMTQSLLIKTLLQRSNFSDIFKGKKKYLYGLQLFHLYLFSEDLFINLMRIFFRVANLEVIKALFFSLRISSDIIRPQDEPLLQHLAAMWRKLLKLMPTNTPFLMVPIDILTFGEYQRLIKIYPDLTEIEFSTSGIGKSDILTEGYIHFLKDTNVLSVSLTSIECAEEAAVAMNGLKITQLGWMSNAEAVRDLLFANTLARQIKSLIYGVLNPLAFDMYHIESQAADLTVYDVEQLQRFELLEEIELINVSNPLMLFTQRIIEPAQEDREAVLAPLPFSNLRKVTFRHSAPIDDVDFAHFTALLGIQHVSFINCTIDIAQLFLLINIPGLETVEMTKCVFQSARYISKNLGFLSRHERLRHLILSNCVISVPMLNNLESKFKGKLVIK